MLFRTITTILFIAVCLFGFSLFAQEIKVISISGAEEKADIRTSDGKVRTVRVGDVIGRGQLKYPSDLRVEAISDGRIILIGTIDGLPETIIIKTDKGQQKIVRMRKAGEKPALVVVPAPVPGKNTANK